MDADEERPVFKVEGPRNLVGGAPVDGMSYLRSVVYEASQISNVHVSAIDPRKYDAHQTRFVAVHKHAFPPAPEGLATKVEWATSFAEKFENMRQQLEGLRGSAKKATFPSYKDEANWHKYCFGVPLQNAQGQSNEDTMQIDDQESAKETKSTFPPLHSLLGIDEVRVTAVTNFSIQWLVGDQNPNKILQDPLLERRLAWLFTWLALLDKPLDADTSANLRMLLRVLCKLRAALTALDRQAAQISVLIALLTTSFGQYETIL